MELSDNINDLKNIIDSYYNFINLYFIKLRQNDLNNLLENLPSEEKLLRIINKIKGNELFIKKNKSGYKISDQFKIKRKKSTDDFLFSYEDSLKGNRDFINSRINKILNKIKKVKNEEYKELYILILEKKIIELSYILELMDYDKEFKKYHNNVLQMIKDIDRKIYEIKKEKKLLLLDNKDIKYLVENDVKFDKRNIIKCNKELNETKITGHSFYKYCFELPQNINEFDILDIRHLNTSYINNTSFRFKEDKIKTIEKLLGTELNDKVRDLLSYIYLNIKKDNLIKEIYNYYKDVKINLKTSYKINDIDKIKKIYNEKKNKNIHWNNEINELNKKLLKYDEKELLKILYDDEIYINSKKELFNEFKNKYFKLLEIKDKYKLYSEDKNEIDEDLKFYMKIYSGLSKEPNNYINKIYNLNKNKKKTECEKELKFYKNYLSELIDYLNYSKFIIENNELLQNIFDKEKEENIINILKERKKKEDNIKNIKLLFDNYSSSIFRNIKNII